MAVLFRQHSRKIERICEQRRKALAGPRIRATTARTPAHMKAISPMKAHHKPERRTVKFHDTAPALLPATRGSRPPRVRVFWGGARPSHARRPRVPPETSDTEPLKEEDLYPPHVSPHQGAEASGPLAARGAGKKKGRSQERPFSIPAGGAGRSTKGGSAPRRSKLSSALRPGQPNRSGS